MDLPLASLGIFVTAFYVGYVLSNILAGFAGDLLGPRITLTVSLLCLAAATAGFGLVQTMATGLAMQVLMGLSAGADYAAGVKLIATWFGRLERGRAMGLFMTATSLAVLLVNLTVPVLLDATSWRSVYLVLGIATAAVGVAAFAVVRDRPGARVVQQRADYRALLGNRQLLLLGLAGFGALWGTWGFAFWAGTLMTRGRGLSSTQAGLVLALFAAGALVAKPAVGWLSDLLNGRRGLAIGCLLFFAAMLLVFSQLDGFTVFAAAGPLLGVGAFGYSPLMNTMVAEASGARMAASGAGFTNAFWGLGNVVVPSVVGLVFAATGSFALAFVTLAVGPLAGAACLAFTSNVALAKPDGTVADIFG